MLNSAIFFFRESPFGGVRSRPGVGRLALAVTGAVQGTVGAVTAAAVFPRFFILDASADDQRHDDGNGQNEKDIDDVSRKPRKHGNTPLSQLFL